MSYSVCILAAGMGNRMGQFTKHLNKVMLPLDGKPAICHIIEKFDENFKIVIAVGYLKDSLISYLKTEYPKRKLVFVEVNPYTGKGSGPGFSLLCCKKELQGPFILIAGDTLVKEGIPLPDKNWIGVAKVKDTSRFCSIKEANGRVIDLSVKIKTDNELAYIGLMGIKDYKEFWEGLENNKDLIENELQVTNGISQLIDKGLFTKDFTWFDTGTPSAYEYAIKNYPNGIPYSGE